MTQELKEGFEHRWLKQRGQVGVHALHAGLKSPGGEDWLSGSTLGKGKETTVAAHLPEQEPGPTSCTTVQAEEWTPILAWTEVKWVAVNQRGQDIWSV